ncbi:hypothetical protein BH18ACT14_BH18ACT14_20470 [soil metagenome]
MLPHMADRRALLRKLENVEAFPLIALQALPELRADLDAVEAEALLRARELGASLEDIAEALAITRQGVAYKLKALAGNGHDHEDAEETAEAEVIEISDEADQAEVADEAEDEVVDITEPEPQAEQPQAEPEAQEPQPETRWPSLEDLRADPEARRTDIDPRVPHTKA